MYFSQHVIQSINYEYILIAKQFFILLFFELCRFAERFILFVRMHISNM